MCQECVHTVVAIAVATSAAVPFIRHWGHKVIKPLKKKKECVCEECHCGDNKADESIIEV